MSIWTAFQDFIFWGIDVVYGFVGDWGMAIVLVTILFRLIIWPLMNSQIRSSYQMQKMQPLMQEVQTKYANDPQRMQEEMQKIYAEAKFNPISGCLPLLLQMPIFMALFQVLQQMGDRTSGTSYEFYHLVPDLTLSPQATFSQGFLVFLPYIILLLIFAFTTFLPTLLMQRGTANAQQRKQTLIMTLIMSLFMLWIGWGSPAGVLLFWGTSSILGLIQTQTGQRRMKRLDAEKESEIEDKPVEVDVTRREHKKRPRKKH